VAAIVLLAFLLGGQCELGGLGGTPLGPRVLARVAGSVRSACSIRAYASQRDAVRPWPLRPEATCVSCWPAHFCSSQDVCRPWTSTHVHRRAGWLTLR